MNKKYTVASDGSGDFLTVQEALQVQDDSLTLFVKNGIYKGPVFSTKKELHIIGEDEKKTIFTGSTGAKNIFSDGSKTGTFRTYTAYFSGEKATLENLTIENTAGQGTVAGQAIALYASASYMYCKNVRLLGYQDTLFTAPLPEKEHIKGGFTGPEEKLPRRPSVQCYENCFISGTIDFIFGSADALFTNCTIALHDTETECYIAAPSTPPDRTGYIFNHCTVVQAEPFSPEKNERIFLGRPWREYAKCCWMNSSFSNIICSESWDNWGNVQNEKTSDFSVYKNTWKHAGIAGKGTFARNLTDSEALSMLKKAEKIYCSAAASCSREASKNAPIPLSSSEITGSSI